MKAPHLYHLFCSRAGVHGRTRRASPGLYFPPWDLLPSYSRSGVGQNGEERGEVRSRRGITAWHSCDLVGVYFNCAQVWSFLPRLFSLVSHVVPCLALWLSSPNSDLASCAAGCLWLPCSFCSRRFGSSFFLLRMSHFAESLWDRFFLTGQASLSTLVTRPGAGG